MKDLRKVTPERYKLLQDIDTNQIEIDNLQIGYELLMPSERREVNKQLEHLYQLRSSMKRQLRNEL